MGVPRDRLPRDPLPSLLMHLRSNAIPQHPPRCLASSLATRTAPSVASIPTFWRCHRFQSDLNYSQSLAHTFSSTGLALTTMLIACCNIQSRSISVHLTVPRSVSLPYVQVTYPLSAPTPAMEPIAYLEVTTLLMRQVPPPSIMYMLRLLL